MPPPDTASCDVAIVGGGPAGLAAAECLLAAGLSVTVIDEQLRLGGQIARQPPVPFTLPHWLSGNSYRDVKTQLRRTESMAFPFLGGTTAAGLFAEESGFVLWLSSAGGLRKLSARRVLLAPGCYDLPAALPGWTLPGVMTVGGIQSLLKAQGILAGDRILLAGTHPLQLILAHQILAAGGRIAAVVFAQHRRVLVSLLHHPLLTLRNTPGLLGMAQALFSLRRAGVPVRFGQTLSSIAGDRTVESVALSSIDRQGRVGGPSQTIACDLVGLGFGFLPQSELARSAGAEAVWSQPVGGWAIRHDTRMQSSVPGLYVAGEIAGVGGAPVALLEGKLAALGILADLRGETPKETQAAAKLRRRRNDRRRFADLIARLSSPIGLLPQLATPETLLCRCENVRFAELDQAALGPLAIDDANAAKLLTRVGMGLCQGRNCEYGALCRLAGQTGRDIGTLAGFTARFPVKPIPIGDLLDMDD